MFNYSDDPGQLYRAEVELIAHDEWAVELRELFGDLFDPDGTVSKRHTDSESEASIAFSKITAVYPEYTKERLNQTRGDPQPLIEDPQLKQVLGTARQLSATTSVGLLKQLRLYVDSQEKSATMSMAYWPLIRAVKIYIKARALSTGAVLVDLASLSP